MQYKIQVFIGVTLLLFSGIVIAQENIDDESTVVYQASYFAEWSPVTAQDMLDRIPGLDMGSMASSNRSSRGSRSSSGGRSSGGGRGFGGGNRTIEILINGKRTAGKNNSTDRQLSRIISDQVDRIEIIRGTSGDLDVRGSGQVINVILYEELSAASLQYEFSAEHSPDKTVKPRDEDSYNCH